MTEWRIRVLPVTATQLDVSLSAVVVDQPTVRIVQMEFSNLDVKTKYGRSANTEGIPYTYRLTQLEEYAARTKNTFSN